MHFRPNKVLEALAHHQTINTAELEMVRQNPITPNCNSPNLHSTPLSGSATDEIPRANKVSQQSESEVNNLNPSSKIKHFHSKADQQSPGTRSSRSPPSPEHQQVAAIFGNSPPACPP